MLEELSYRVDELSRARGGDEWPLQLLLKVNGAVAECASAPSSKHRNRDYAWGYGACPRRF